MIKTTFVTGSSGRNGFRYDYFYIIGKLNLDKQFLDRLDVRGLSQHGAILGSMFAVNVGRWFVTLDISCTEAQGVYDAANATTI